ncbi:MAG: hypothetical protein DMG47_02490 [Acidobacteria bacterium]|nr:MAG: hypothetical protein DMG47_02490 [Acidobacteriota bacterium]
MPVALVVLDIGWIIRRIVHGTIPLNVTRCAGLGRRSDLDVRTGILRGLDLTSAHLRDGRRPSAIGLNDLLLFDERSGGWRRSGPGDNCAVHCDRRRTHARFRTGAEHAALLRCNGGRGRIDLRRLKFPAINLHHVLSDRLSRRKCFVRSDGDSVRGSLVHVSDVGDILVDDDVVVVVVDNDVVHRRVGNIDVCNVGAADAIRRHVDFTRRKREPGHADSTAATDSDAHAEVRPADPGDESRGVNRAHVGHTHDCAGRARHPAPHAADDNPAAVMEGSKSPGLIINPGPAPRGNPNPMPVAIRSPTDNSGVWKPNVAIFGNGAPASVLIEVFVTNDIGRNIARGLRVIFAPVTVTAPAVEVVAVVTETLNVGIELVGTGKRASFPRMNGVGGAAAGDFTLAIADQDNRGVARFVDVDFVVAGAQNGEGEVGRIDFESLVLVKAAHTHVQDAFGDADLHRAIVEIQKRKASVAGKADRCGADVELCT